MVVLNYVQEVLANMLPSPRHAEALMNGATIVDELQDVTLLYSDMVGFTSLSAKMSSDELCSLLNRIYTAFDSHLDELGVYKMDTIGDAFIVVGGMYWSLDKNFVDVMRCRIAWIQE